MKTTQIAAIAAVFLVLLGFVVAPAMAANADNGLYTSKYAPAPTTTATQTGIIKGTIRAHQNAISTELKITGPSGTFIVPILADGSFELNNLAPGVYTIVLADGNGGQPEVSTATVKAGQISFPEREVLGHAVSVASGKVKPTVINASYGMIETREKTIVDAEAYDETIVDSEAQDIFHPAVTHIVHHPAVTHQEKVIDVPAQPAVPDTYKIVAFGEFTGYAKIVGSNSPHDFTINGVKYQIVGDKHALKYLKIAGHPAVPEQSHYVTVVDAAAYDEVVVDAEAYTEHIAEVTHTVHHDAITHIETYQVGSYVDVTAQVQKAINDGVAKIVFDNGQNPGGMFNADTNALIAQIDDPAYGIVKKVVINFAGGKHIEAAEYEAITL